MSYCLWPCGLVARQRHFHEVHSCLVPGVAEISATANRVLATAGRGDRRCTCDGDGTPAESA